MIFDDDEVFVDKNSYKTIWENVIHPTMCKYQDRYSYVLIAHNAEEAILSEYVRFNRHTKCTYMKDSGGKIDRHKVCACYMYAIVKANTLSCQLADSDTERSYLALNENLAITVGMSLLRAFILSNINSKEDLTETGKQNLRERVRNGIMFPKCNHGDYRSNFIAELHYTHEENRYNILSLANTLFLLEEYTLYGRA